MYVQDRMNKVHEYHASKLNQYKYPEIQQYSRRISIARMHNLSFPESIT